MQVGSAWLGNGPVSPLFKAFSAFAPHTCAAMSTYRRTADRSQLVVASVDGAGISLDTWRLQLLRCNSSILLRTEREQAQRRSTEQSWLMLQLILLKQEREQQLRALQDNLMNCEQQI
eukprot:jgi/Chrzof1/3169/Cz12g14120.t1